MSARSRAPRLPHPPWARRSVPRALQRALTRRRRAALRPRRRRIRPPRPRARHPLRPPPVRPARPPARSRSGRRRSYRPQRDRAAGPVNGIEQRGPAERWRGARRRGRFRCVVVTWRRFGWRSASVWALTATRHTPCHNAHHAIPISTATVCRGSFRRPARRCAPQRYELGGRIRVDEVACAWDPFGLDIRHCFNPYGMFHIDRSSHHGPS